MPKSDDDAVLIPDCEFQRGSNKYPECRKYVEMGFHNAQFNFRLDDTRIGEAFQGKTPSRNDGELVVVEPPKGYPVPVMPDMPNEHAPGLFDLNN